MIELMEYLGNPQDSYKVLHIAGTSGKTSTAYYTAALLTASGKKTGLMISPHIESLAERAQINMKPLPEQQFLDELNEFMAIIDRSELQLNYFEVLYAFTFWEFARRKVEYAVVETGIGGLLDHTNVITRRDKVCILTDIGYDHMSILGTTLPEIAAQKAGIILLHNAVFCWRQPKEVLDVFQTTVRQKQADLYVLEHAEIAVDVAFLPLFQQRNFELARQAVVFVLQRDGAPALSRQDTLHAAHTFIPARMEVYELGRKTIIIDGSHNPQKLHALMESVQAQYPGQAIAALVGFAKSKTPESRIDAGMQELLAAVHHVIITEFTINRLVPRRSVDPAAVVEVCKAAGFSSYEVVSDPAAGLAALINRPEPVGVVAGSFFLLNSIRPLLSQDVL